VATVGLAADRARANVAHERAHDSIARSTTKAVTSTIIRQMSRITLTLIYSLFA
jgi:hypothetical protein